MTGQSTLPNVQYFNRMLRIIFPSVEKHMAQSSADNGCNNQVNKQTFEPFQVNVLVFEHLLTMIVSEKETQGKQKAVPTNLQRP